MNNAKLRKMARALYRSTHLSPVEIAGQLEVRPRFVYRALGWSLRPIYNPETGQVTDTWVPLAVSP